MATEIEYALMAGASYISTRSDINRFPAPQGWTEIAEFRRNDPSSGFEATSFIKGTEIVISYAGTDPADLLGDIAADIGLATGVGSTQLLQAAEYYLQVQAANPTATITFTGHSLGGGLAALMGVFFGKRAVTFDQAPFANSAELNVLTPDVVANLKADLLARGYSEGALSGLTDFIQLRAVTGGIPNSSLVDSINVQGEFLSGVPWNIPDRIGIPVNIPNSAPGVSESDLHSQALLTAFLQNIQTAVPQQALHDVTFMLTDLMGMIFANSLYARSTGTANTTEENFLERLVRHEAGVGIALPADRMVTRFTNDLWKLAQDGGLTIADDPAAATRLVSNTLIAFAMQMYYENTANATNPNKELFAEVSGGVHLDRADVAASLDQAKGYTLYFQNYLNSDAFTAPERQVIQSLLPTLRDWYVQAGANGMNVADAHNRGAFMLGGTGGDTMTGGTQADLLVGNAGADTFNGKGGNDMLFGGVGFDTYIYNSGDGTDRIEDASGQNAILFDQQLLQGGIRKITDPSNTYTSLDGRFTYVQSGGDLIVNGSLILNENFQDGQFGIRLVDLPAYAEVTRTEFLKVDHYMQVGNDANGNPLYEPVYAPFFDGSANDSRSSALTPPIGDENNLIYAGGGNDTVITGSGDDQLYGEDGDDVLAGFGGNDRLYGGIGHDTINGDDSLTAVSGNDYLDGGEGDDVLQGSAGSDVVLGGSGNDSLNGDDLQALQLGIYGNDFLDGGDDNDELHGVGGSDVLYGGAGNDFLLGDATISQGGTPEAGGDDSLDGGSGDDYLDGQFGDDVLLGGLDDDGVNGGDGSDVLYGGAGNDTLSGDLRLVSPGGGYDLQQYRAVGGEDLLFGEVGQDVLTGGEGNDVLNGGTENDFLFGDYITSRVSTSDPLYWALFTVDGDDRLQGEAGNDILHGGFGVDSLVAGDGNDTLIGGAGDDVLEGGADDDILYGEYAFNSPEFFFNPFISNIKALTGNDRLDGGAGQDELHGGEGADTLLGGAGKDRLIDDEPGYTVVGGNDVLDGGEGADILKSYYGDDVLHGGEGNDQLSSFLGHDALYGDDGDDWLSSGFEEEGQGSADTTMIGGLGDDTYWIDGTGDVVLEEVGGGLDTVSSFISYTLPDFSENLTLWGTVGIGNGLNNVMRILPGGGRLEGLDGDDDLSGYVGDDTLDGGAGKDQLFGDVGNDRLIGGAGNDTYLINLADGVDTIEDTAFGAEGNGIRFGEWILQSDLTLVRNSTTLDIQIGNRGGVVRLLNFDPTGVNGSLVVQMLAFADGSTVNLADLFSPMVNHAPTLSAPLADQTVPEDAPFSLVVPADTFVDEDAGDVLTLSASLADGKALPAWLSFDAATATFSGTPDDVQVGTLDLRVTATDREDLTVSNVFSLTVANVNEAPTVVAPPADQQATEDTAFSFVVLAGTFVDVDRVHGDTLTYSATLADGTALPTWLSFDPTTRTFGGTPLNSDVGTLALTVTATDQGTLSTSAWFTLSVQNTNDAPTVANPVADQTAAEDSAFTFTVPNTTFADADLIHGDILTYNATLADGSPLPAWLSFNPSSSTFSGIPGAGDAGSLQIAVIATDTGKFSTTDLFTLAISGPLPQTVIGTAGNDLLTGGRGDDTLIGLAGNDTLNGGQGYDQLDGGTGTDTMQGGTGNDTYIVDVSGDVVTELANEGTDTVQSSITSTLGAHVENLTLTGTANLNGTGNALDNTLMGNSGINVLTGGWGNDTYLVGTGDTVVENHNGGTDTIVSSVTWTLGANVENLTLTGTANLSGTGSSANNVLVGNNGNNALDGGSGNDRADGGDGSDSLLGGSGADQLLGGLGNDVLNAGSGNDVLNGGDGTDTLDGGSGDDQLLGGAGSDTLIGGSGADKFTGGIGNDALTGGSGSDLYDFSRGDGQDTIIDSDPFPGNQDRALFGTTINPLDLVISRQANDLRVAIHGSSNQITVQNWYVGTTNRIETIQAGNGQTLLSTHVDQLIQAMASFTEQTGLTWDQAIDQQPAQVESILAASWQ